MDRQRSQKKSIAMLPKIKCTTMMLEDKVGRSLLSLSKPPISRINFVANRVGGDSKNDIKICWKLL